MKKTLESISFERRRGIEEDSVHYEVDELVNRTAVVEKVVVPVSIQQ